MKKLVLLSLLALGMTAHADKPYRSVAQILSEAPKDAWYRLDQQHLLYLTLAGNKKVVIELAPRFAPAHAKQIKTLADSGYWDGLTVSRVQDNFVAQFGAFDMTSKKDIKDLPATASTKLPAEFTVPARDLPLTALPDKDPYANKVGFVDGFAVGVHQKEAFLVQCYGMVGAGRQNEPDSSHGGNLYVVIGQPARSLDRQITVVGRVVHGIEHLSSLPRGTGELGFYQGDEKPTAIISARMGDKLPADEQLQFEALDTRSRAFKDSIEARRYLQSPWHVAKPSGGMGICDVRQTVRLVK